MTILFAASEMVPFCKTGGLADVIGALTRVIAAKGHNVWVMLPGYTAIDRGRYRFVPVAEGLEVPVGGQDIPLGLSQATVNGVQVILLENPELFGRPGLYGDTNGDYADNATRFIFYSRGVLTAARHLRVRPQVVHAHDWQAGLVNAYVAFERGHDLFFGGARSVFTIHNLGYQGIYPADVFPLTGLPSSAFNLNTLEYYGNVSYLKGGLVYADALTTVSPTYAGEITQPELGFGMEGVLASRREALHGVLNGLDVEVWDPATDPVIPMRYSVDDRAGKAVCREVLLRRFGLEAGPDVPVFGMVSRLDLQKGIDVLGDAMERLAAMDIRIVILGTGIEQYNQMIGDLAARYAGKIAAHLHFDDAMAHLIYAGSDGFLMPSAYEPCGLGQLIALRYGTLPVAHATGGLADTVTDLDGNTKLGTGFTYHDQTADEFVGAVERAVAVFGKRGRARWRAAVKRAMLADYSWASSADRYIDLYSSIRHH